MRVEKATATAHASQRVTLNPTDTLRTKFKANPNTLAYRSLWNDVPVN